MNLFNIRAALCGILIIATGLCGMALQADTTESSPHKFTITPDKGHYKSDSGSRHIDRDMTPEELQDAITPCRWKIEKDENGNEYFIIPFEDGSRFDYRRDGSRQDR